MEDSLKRKINMLIQVALSDGDFDIRERAFIYNISLRKGIPLDTIGDMIEAAEPVQSMMDLSPEVRIESLTECLQLILIDGKVLPKEIAFCKTLGEHLGFTESQVDSVLMHVRSNPEITFAEISAYISKGLPS